MLDPIEIATFAALGVVFAVGVAFLARWAGQSPVRIGAYALIAVSFIYVGLAFGAESANSWVAVEMTGVALFGSAALASLISTPWLVVAGLLLHPVWALYIHLHGAGSVFTPAPIAVANAGFDLALGFYLAFLVWRGAGAKSPAPAPANANRKSRKERAS